MEEHTESLNISIKTCSALSLLTVIFTIFVYFKYKSDLPVFYLFVLATQLSCAINLIIKFIPASESCAVLGLIGTYGILSAVAWSGILAQKFYARHVYEEEISKNIPIYLFIAYVLPGILAALPLFTESYGNIGGYCWIKGKNSFIWRIFAYYLFVTLAIIFTFRRYHLVIKAIKEDIQDLPNSSVLIQEKNSSFRRMRMYSVILLITFCPSLLYIVVDASGGGNEYYELVCMCFECLFAFFNTVVYLCKHDIMVMVGNSLICKKQENERNVSNFLTMEEKNFDHSVFQEFSVI
jgi:hypothetical protein